MAVIDQRILLVAPSEAIWPYLTDPALLTRWNRGARQVSILTTRPAGVGLRRRVTDEEGKSVVEQVTAWVENIGYEYILIEGPYRSYTGRLRLQPVPEGTVLNWVIDYHLRGPFGGLRNVFGRRQKMGKQMAESLRGLRRMIDSSGIRLDVERQKRVAMQADPGLAARQARMSEPTVRQPGGDPRTGGGINAALPPTPGWGRPLQPPPVLGEDELPELPPPQPTGYPTSVPTSVPTSIPTSMPTNVPRSIPTLAPRPTTPPLPPALPPNPKPVPNVQPAPPILSSRPQPSVAPDRASANEPPKPAVAGLSAGMRGPLVPEPPITADDTKPSPRKVDDPTLQNEAPGNDFATVPLDLVAPKPPLDPEPPTATQNIPSVPPPLVEVPHALTPDDATRKVEDGQTRSEPAPTQSMPPAAEESGAQPPVSPGGKARETGATHQSIWDIFGVPRPSQQEKEDLGAIIAGLKPKLPEIDPPPTQPPVFQADVIDSEVPHSNQPSSLPEPDLFGPSSQPPGDDETGAKPSPVTDKPAKAAAEPADPDQRSPRAAPARQPETPTDEPIAPPTFDPTVTREVIMPWPDLPSAMLSIADEPTPATPRSMPPIPALPQQALPVPIPLVPTRTGRGRLPKAAIRVRRSIAPTYGKASIKVRKVR